MGDGPCAEKAGAEAEQGASARVRTVPQQMHTNAMFGIWTARGGAPIAAWKHGMQWFRMVLPDRIELSTSPLPRAGMTGARMAEF